jgi:hypothetical protein
VTVVPDTLNQLPVLAKTQRKFIVALLSTILALRGRVNYRNLARYGHYSERTYARQFAEPFPGLEYHTKVIQSALPRKLPLASMGATCRILRAGC